MSGKQKAYREAVEAQAMLEAALADFSKVSVTGYVEVNQKSMSITLHFPLQVYGAANSLAVKLLRQTGEIYKHNILQSILKGLREDVEAAHAAAVQEAVEFLQEGGPR